MISSLYTQLGKEPGRTLMQGKHPDGAWHAAHHLVGSAV